MPTQTHLPQAQAGQQSHPRGLGARERNRALWRRNLRSSAVGAGAAAIFVGVLAAVDPAIPWASVVLRAAAALVLGATLGSTLSLLSHSLRVLRSREARFRSGDRIMGADGPVDQRL